MSISEAIATKLRKQTLPAEIDRFLRGMDAEEIQEVLRQANAAHAAVTGNPFFDAEANRKLQTVKELFGKLPG